mmetsp:Transcript_33260/g.96979  ORF Transcript_33260/g.96979 Transcript_33260/m.96979 type:complete len:81 (-) Transcript_33260:13-255(-)
MMEGGGGQTLGAWPGFACPGSSRMLVIRGTTADILILFFSQARASPFQAMEFACNSRRQIDPRVRASVEATSLEASFREV